MARVFEGTKKDVQTANEVQLVIDFGKANSTSNVKEIHGERNLFPGNDLGKQNTTFPVFF